VTRLLDPPRPIEVRTGEDERPTRISGGGPLTGEVRAVQGWITEVDWWSRPISREYWRVLVRGRLLCEIYRDRTDGAWYLERVYD
jgi:hypothetical protein